MADQTLSPTESSSPAPHQSRRELVQHGLRAFATLLGLAAASCREESEGDEPQATDAGGSDAAASDAASLDAGLPDATSSADSAADSAAEAATAPSDASVLDADVGPLMALLTDKYRELAAYNAALTVVEVAPPGGMDGTLEEMAIEVRRQDLLTVIAEFQRHHRIHIAAIVEALRALGATPVDEQSVVASYVPPSGFTANKSFDNVVRLLANTERTLVVSSNDAVGNFEAAKHRFLAGTIAGVDAQQLMVWINALRLNTVLLLQPGDLILKPFVKSLPGQTSGLDALPPVTVP